MGDCNIFEQEMVETVIEFKKKIFTEKIQFLKLEIGPEYCTSCFCSPSRIVVGFKKKKSCGTCGLILIPCNTVLRLVWKNILMNT